MDPKRPKIQSSRIQTKPVPSCSARRVDSDSIFFFENGLCMRKISRSEVFPKHAKKSQSQSQQSVLLTSAVRQHDMEDDVIMTS
jgi:hypothetical protein